ncbi:carboxy terminal-processing peptidase [Vibrio ostreicida]|uniref:Carboxy terminal-processing peptidase n=1 Tax=Vibrio ostreicida TaxID=526588 RepID=A0ABT8BTP3_9VIBR|nr:carboxy terminal-processing peptidase [Vibrio ostreicida]MDN3610074.1 carboxy terminal-processing peptidase [Vibrio ostreicida]NPD10056.1 carboxy terminal-processing peptidase [Vibrio ostreicida]
MKCRSKLSLIAASLLLAAPIANALEAKINLEDLPVLVPETQYITASKRVEDKLTSSHYKHIKLNDAFSQKIFWRYVESLDYSRNVFTQVDIDSFKKWSSGIDDQLKSGQTQIAFDLYNASMKRRYERFAYALSLLDKEMDFKVDESVELDRREMPWAKDTAELDELWRKRVKYDALNLKLAGKDWPAIKEVLGKRYNNALKRLSQTHNEDAFQLYMNAFTRAIDPHTTYLSPQSAEKFQTDMNLSLEGIGAVLQMTDDYTVIRSLVVGGPASNSKQLAEGDKIIGVGQDKEDIVDVIGWRLDDVVKLIKGPKGTKVYLQILSEGKDAKADVITIVRDKIRLEDRAVKSEVIERGDKKIGVLSVPSFYVGLAKDTDQLLAELKQQQVDGIVVDLRNNGGGALTEASALTGLFIASGPVVQVRDSYGRINVKGDFDDKLSYDGPMTVLINRNSASASEIFAAALQDYGRAIILGENSFGKGTVQQHLRLSKLFDLFDKQLGAVQYTIQKFYRIDGGSTQLKGVKPDIAFPTLIDPDETGESVEDNALPWDRIAKAKYQVLQRNEKQIAMLNTQHQARIADDLEFQFIAEDIAQYKADKDDNTLSLNEKVRKQESDDADKLRLQRINLRQKAKDAEPFTTLDDVPKDYERPDVYLDEAVAITVDSLK